MKRTIEQKVAELHGRFRHYFRTQVQGLHEHTYEVTGTSVRRGALFQNLRVHYACSCGDAFTGDGFNMTQHPLRSSRYERLQTHVTEL